MASAVTRPFKAWKGVVRLLKSRRQPGAVEDQDVDDDEVDEETRAGFLQGDSVLQVCTLSPESKPYTIIPEP